jgi:3-oxoacyl-[acyl-carrier protein] reductase
VAPWRVLVTGASHGLGAAIVDELTSSGARVAFTFDSSTELAHSLVAQHEAEGRKVVALRADARAFDRAFEVVDEVVQTFGGLDALVNNVGGAGADEGPIWTMREETWDQVIALNLKSCFNYTRAVVPHFMTVRAGTIVNVGSINGLRGRETQPAYTAAKAGMLGFTKTTAKELGPYGVTVNMIATGYVDTPKQRRKVSPDHKARIVADTALKRLIEPQEVAQAIAFLLSPGAASMTGAVLRLDAGEYI